jgi:hypothetical protein
MDALAATPELMSVDEFLAWDSDDGQMWQLVDGQPQAIVPIGAEHRGTSKAGAEVILFQQAD